MKTSTINKTEINKFNKLAAEWWNPEGSFKPLHKFNPIRIKYIKDNIIQHFNIKSKNMPLKNNNFSKRTKSNRVDTRSRNLGWAPTTIPAVIHNTGCRRPFYTHPFMNQPREPGCPTPAQPVGRSRRGPRALRLGAQALHQERPPRRRQLASCAAAKLFSS